MSGNTKIDNINGMLQLYHPLSVSEKLAPGPIVVTVEITIDNIKSQAQNGFVIH